MTEVNSNTPLKEIRSEFNPAKVSKCGEIQITDCCTNAYIFCAFCYNYGSSSVITSDTQFFTTLHEFIDHIRWHRSDDLDSPSLQNGISTTKNQEGIRDESQSDVLCPPPPPPIQQTEFLTDWIAPPEELFASNMIGSFVEMEPQSNEIRSVDITDQDQQQQQQTDEPINTNPAPSETHIDEDEDPDLTGEVFIELVDLYKKCPCLWHECSASKTTPEVISGVYKLLTMHYNNLTQKSKSEKYVRELLTQVRSCFLEEFKNVIAPEENENLPWYFPYLKFILDYDSPELDESVFTDFNCPLCALELPSQKELWRHLHSIHIEFQTNPTQSPVLANDDFNDENDTEFIPTTPINTDSNQKTIFSEYPIKIVDKFIDLYRSQKDLWDKNHPEYHNSILRQKIANQLLNILREHNPKVTNDDVELKINELGDLYLSDDEDEENSHCLQNGHDEAIEELNTSLNQNKAEIKRKKNPPPQLKVKSANLRKKVNSAKCPICAIPFTEHSTWLSHIDTAHPNNDYQSKDGFFYCSVCGWKNRTKKLLMRHLRTRHTNNLHKCKDCKMSFRLLSALAVHRAKVHDDFNPFKCEICSEVFSTRSQLRKHTSTHESTDELKTQKPSVQRHKRDTKNKLLCKYCQKKLPTISELRKHLRTHLRLMRTHKCDKCGKAFQRTALLQKHLNEAHVSEENVSNTSQTFMDVFKNQMLTNNSSQTSCEICGAKFLRKISLQKHKRLKHKFIIAGASTSSL